MKPELRLKRLKQLKNARSIVPKLEQHLQRAKVVVATLEAQLGKKPQPKAEAKPTVKIISDTVLMEPEAGEQVLFAPNQARII